MTVVLVDGETNGAKTTEGPSSLTLTPDSFNDSVVSASLEAPGLPETLDAKDDSLDSASAVASSGDQHEYALMAGRYLGQITARIERAWVKPKDPIEGGIFACRVRITQDQMGGIQRIVLSRCNGDERWQASLLSAIKTSSPLPGAPDPSVFARVLTFELNSAQYVDGGSAEGFER